MSDARTNEIRRLRRRVRLLTAALAYARSKFHGTQAAVAMVRAGEGQLDLAGGERSMREGNALCSRILGAGEYMDAKTVDRVLGGHLKRITKGNG
jgi:hypothetical protein